MAILAERIFLFARERLIEQRGFIRARWIRTPGGQGLMSASCAFGSQSSRSPQARAPILSPSSFQPFLSTVSLHRERNTFLLFAFVPLYFARPPSILDFLPFHPFLFHEIYAFFTPYLPPLERAARFFFFFFFFKTRDDEICLAHSFLFYLLNFVISRIRIQIPSPPWDHTHGCREIASKSCLCS